MRRPPAIAVLVMAALSAAFALALRSGAFPLGVPGEWTWPRIKPAPAAWPVAVAIGAVLAFSALAAAGWHSLGRHPGFRRESAWVAALALGSTLVQGLVQEGAPEGYGLSKWIIALDSPGASGYHTVAKAQMRDPARFLAEYSAWIVRQDALHVGTHPPGLFLVARGLLDLTGSRPGLAKAVVDLAPGTCATAIRAMRDSGLTRPDAAALTLTGALTLLACASTVAPLYCLARASLPARAAWASAVLWPLAPSAILFQPTADTAFPFLATSALALAAWARRSEGRAWALALATGVVLAVGMTFTLAYLAVGLVVALILIAPPGPTLRRRLGLIAATGLGFLATTLAGWATTSANPFAIWWTNQQNHARFYREYHRSYAAWVLANPVELAVGLGLPATVWAAIGFAAPRRCPRVAWATLAVLATLTLTGRSLSEVGRLWLPLMPPLLVAAGAGLDRIGAGAKSLAASVALTGLLALILEATIQVVYPF